LPAAIEIGFTDAEGEYARAAVGSRRLAGTSRREIRADVAVVARRGEVKRLADIQLQDLWAGRESVDFALSPREVALEPGDVLRLAAPGAGGLYRITRIADGRCGGSPLIASSRLSSPLRPCRSRRAGARRPPWPDSLRRSC
jgi:hypothetical protein